MKRKKRKKVFEPGNGYVLDNIDLGEKQVYHNGEWLTIEQLYERFKRASMTKRNVLELTALSAYELGKMEPK